MKLFHFHILLIRSFILYVLTCLLISQSALSVCSGCGSAGDTLPDSSLCPSCSSSASEAGAGAEAGLIPENFRTFLRSAIENLPADHALFLDGRYRSIIDALREQGDIAPPTDVTNFLDEMERRVETLNNQITVNDSNRLELVQPRNAFTFPLTVMHALSNGVLDRRNVYGMASRTFVILQMLFPVRATDTEEQRSARQQLISSMYEALLIYFWLTLSDQDASVFLQNTLEEYINSYRSQLPHLRPGTSIFKTLSLISFEVTGRLSHGTITPSSNSVIPNSMQLHHIASLRLAAVLEHTLNNVSYMTLLSLSQPPVTVTISPDQSETFLQNVRDVHNSNPEVDQQRFIYNASHLLEAISLVSPDPTFGIISTIALAMIYFSSKSNTGK